MNCFIRFFLHALLKCPLHQVGKEKQTCLHRHRLPNQGDLFTLRGVSLQLILIRHVTASRVLTVKTAGSRVSDAVSPSLDTGSNFSSAPANASSMVCLMGIKECVSK